MKSTGKCGIFAFTDEDILSARTGRARETQRMILLLLFTGYAMRVSLRFFLLSEGKLEKR